MLHWGADLGELGAAGSVAALLPAGEAGSGLGLMRLAGTHDGQTTGPRFADVQVRLVGHAELTPGGSGGVPRGLAQRQD